ncbi:MAG: CvpA family protein [Planctomycetota bacterium]
MQLGIYDILVLVMIGGAAFLGWRKGLATQVASIFSIAVSCFVAMNFREQLSGMISAAPPFNTIAAMLVLYLGTSFVIWLLFRPIRASLEKMKLREFDHQMGFVFGGLKGLVLAGIGTMFAFSLYEPARQPILDSESGHLIAKFMVTADAVMPPEVQQLFAQHLGALEQGFELEPGQSGMELDPRRGAYPVADDPAIYPPYGNAAPQDGFRFPTPAVTPGDDNGQPRYIPPSAAKTPSPWGRR